MSRPAPAEYRNPYTPYPGGSSPPAETGPREGISELWTYFWLAIASTAIITFGGVLSWYLVTR